MPVSGEMSAKLVIGVDDALARARLQGFAGTAKTAFGSMEKDFAATTAKMRANAESLTAIGSGMTMLGAAGVATMVPMVKSAMDLDQALRNVNSIAKGGEQGFKALGDQVRAIAKDPLVKDMPVSLANGLYQIYSSGLQGKQALDALRISSVGATAGMTDTATASTVLVAAMNAYGGKTAKDAQHFMDVFFKTVERGVVTFPQLAGGMGNIIGMAAQLKVPIETVGAAVATMTKMGVGADETFTSLNRVFGELLNPSKLMQDALKATGYESGLALLQAKGLAGTMQWLSEVTHGNAAELATMLGEVRATRGAMALTGEGAKIFAVEMQEAYKAAGSAADAAAEQAKGAGFKWEKAMQGINLSGQNTGLALWNAFAPVLTLVSNVAEGINKLSGTAVGKIAVPAAGVGAGALVVGGGVAAGVGMMARMAAGAAQLYGVGSPAAKAAMAVARKAPYGAVALGLLAAGVAYVGSRSNREQEGRAVGGRARGGRIGGSDIAWVGEDGPELAVARGGGVDIIPLSKVPGFAGGGTLQPLADYGEERWAQRFLPRTPEAVPFTRPGPVSPPFNPRMPVGGFGGQAPGALARWGARTGAAARGSAALLRGSAGAAFRGIGLKGIARGALGAGPVGWAVTAASVGWGIGSTVRDPLARTGMFGGGVKRVTQSMDAERDIAAWQEETKGWTTQERQSYLQGLQQDKAAGRQTGPEWTTPQMSWGQGGGIARGAGGMAAQGGRPVGSAMVTNREVNLGIKERMAAGDAQWRGALAEQQAAQQERARYLASGGQITTYSGTHGRKAETIRGGPSAYRHRGSGVDFDAAAQFEGMRAQAAGRVYGGGGAGGIDASYNGGMGGGSAAAGGWSVAQARAGAAEEQPAWMQEALAREQGVIGGGARPTFKPSNAAELGWAGAGQGKRTEGGVAGERARAWERIRKGGSGGAAFSGRLADLPGIMQGIGGGAEDNLQQRMMNAGGLRGMVGGVGIGRGDLGGLDMLTQGEGTGLRAGRGGGDRPLIGEINITVQGSIYGDQRLHTIIKQDIRDAVRDAVLQVGPVGAG